MIRLAISCALAIALCSCTPAADSAARTHAPDAIATPDEVCWESFGEDTFARAAGENKIVLINVVATWCHWCHVMEETTYADPEVAQILAEHFVTIRIDSDARPDVAERYRAWGWPATAVLTPDARPVVNLRGYRKPQVFATLLRELVAERDAGTLGAHTPATPPASRPKRGASDLSRARDVAAAQLAGFWDERAAGWGTPQKYPWPAPVEHALLAARLGGDGRGRERALRTLTAERTLVDPVAGGMYQYSLGGVWDRPHFEKIAMIQAGAIETYALAARATGDDAWLVPARQVARYVLHTMQDPEGGFYTSQDADLRRDGAPTVAGADYYRLGGAERQALGVPRIDTAVYADLTGLTIHALTELHRAGGDEDALAAAIRAGNRLLATHRTPDGAFVHAAGDDPKGLLHLADQAATGRALVGLYDVTADRRWLEAARALGDFVLAELTDPGGGFFAHTEDPGAVGVFAERRKPVEENGTCARFLLELHRRRDGDRSEPSPYEAEARRAIAALGDVSRLRPEGKVVGRYLLAAELLGAPGVDVTVVGRAGDPAAAALWRAALAVYEPRATIEQSRPGERYPDIGRAAIYLCTEIACSSPITDPGRYASLAESFFATSLGGPDAP